MNASPYIIEFQKIGKENIGYLSIASFEDELPFQIKRIFWTYGTPSNVSRGRHAHYETEMILIALNGEINVKSTDRNGLETEFLLRNPNQGLIIPKLCWHEMFYSIDAVQLVMSSTLYDEKDYIRSLDLFKEITKK